MKNIFDNLQEYIVDGRIDVRCNSVNKFIEFKGSVCKLHLYLVNEQTKYNNEEDIDLYNEYQEIINILGFEQPAKENYFDRDSSYNE